MKSWGSVEPDRGRDFAQPEKKCMLYYALVFLIIGFIAAALGAGGAAAEATHISWVLFLIAIIFLLVHLLTGRRPPVN